jgi:hypothetical protein
VKAQQLGGFSKQLADGRRNSDREVFEASGDGAAVIFDRSMCLFSH